MFKLLIALFVAMASAVPPQFPESWGEQPMVQTMDYRPLPGGYGHGSSTLAMWITEQMEKEKAKTHKISFPPSWGEPPMMQTRDLVRLPFDYGMGSGTLRTWIANKAETVNQETAEEYEGFLKGR